MRTPAPTSFFLLALLVLPLAGCIEDVPPLDQEEVSPPVPGDPLVEGSLEVQRSEWDLGEAVIPGDEGLYLVRIHGSVHAPDGDGPFPVVLLMHGRHSTCATVVGERMLQPCPRDAIVTTPIDSYQGYDYLAEHLGALGFVVVSVDANNVNDHDNEMRFLVGDDLGATARARIVHRVLDALADADQATGSDANLGHLIGRLDMTRVGLMGHSRGGEGVARAWVMARDEGALPDGIAIRAVFALAPSDFDRQDIRGVPFAVLLPYCDGDMYDLSGSQLYDDARHDNDAPMHQFLTLGANHNYYNTVWTRSDWTNRGDPWCDEDDEASGRDLPEEQRAHGIAIMGSFFRHYVGQREGLEPYLVGTEPWPVPGVVTSYHPPRAQWIEDDDDHTGSDIIVTGTMETVTCQGTECPAFNTYTTAGQTAIQWSAPSEYRVGVAPNDEDVSFRIGIDPKTVTQAELDGIHVVVHTRTNGEHQETRWPLEALGGFVPPGDDGAKTILNTIRVPLPAGAYEVSLRFESGSGIVQIADWLYV